jgi:hypothetical protein
VSGSLEGRARRVELPAGTLARALTLGALLTAGAAALLVVFPARAGLVAHVWLVLVLAVALAVSLERLRAALPAGRSPFDAAFAPVRRPPARPASLARAEREVTLATGTAFDVHFRLRPALRRVAEGLLLARGVDLDTRPDRAQALLGDETWGVVRPDRPAPADRAAPGLPAVAIGRIVADLERLACS